MDEQLNCCKTGCTNIIRNAPVYLAELNIFSCGSCKTGAATPKPAESERRECKCCGKTKEPASFHGRETTICRSCAFLGKSKKRNGRGEKPVITPKDLGHVELTKHRRGE